MGSTIMIWERSGNSGWGCGRVVVGVMVVFGMGKEKGWCSRYMEGGGVHLSAIGILFSGWFIVCSCFCDELC